MPISLTLTSVKEFDLIRLCGCSFTITNNMHINSKTDGTSRVDLYSIPRKTAEKEACGSQGLVTKP
jgi:hypothetical protein